MSFLLSTHKSTTRTPLPPSTTKATAIALLHNHTTFQNLQPAVTSNITIPSTSLSPASWVITQTPQPAEFRSVTASVPLTGNVTSISGFSDLENGVVIVFQAPMGLHGNNVWRVEGEEGGLELVEEAELTGLGVLMWFVMRTERKTHGEQARRVVEWLSGDEK